MTGDCGSGGSVRLVSAIALAVSFIASACIPPELFSATGGAGGSTSSSIGGGGSGASSGGTTGTTSGSTGGITTGSTSTTTSGTGATTSSTSSTVSSTSSSTLDPYAACIAVCQGEGHLCTPGGDCIITCNGGFNCDTLVKCPVGVPCVVNCTGVNSCVQGVDCSDASSCLVSCDGPKACRGTVASPVQFNCPPGGCEVTCSTSNDVCEEVTMACEGPCSLKCEIAGSCNAVSCTGDCSIDCLAGSTCHAVSCSGGACAVACEGTTSCDQVDCSNTCACDVSCTNPTSCYFDPQCPTGVGPPGTCNINPGCTSVPAGCDNCPP